MLGVIPTQYKTRWLPKGQTPKTALEEAVLRLAKIAKPHAANAG